jgi:hypothetical protein
MIQMMQMTWAMMVLMLSLASPPSLAMCFLVLHRNKVLSRPYKMLTQMILHSEPSELNLKKLLMSCFIEMTALFKF